MGDFLSYSEEETEVSERKQETPERKLDISQGKVFSQGILQKILYISEIILRLRNRFLREFSELERHFFRNSVGKQISEGKKEISDGNKISLGNSERKKIPEIILKFKKILFLREF